MRYLIFASRKYNELGGMCDFQGKFNTYEETMENVRKLLEKFDWIDLYDISTGMAQTFYVDNYVEKADWVLPTEVLKKQSELMDADR